MASKANIRIRDAPTILVVQEFIRVLAGLCQEQGAGTNIYFLSSHTLYSKRVTITIFGKRRDKLRILREGISAELSGRALHAVAVTPRREMLRREDRQEGSGKTEQREM